MIELYESTILMPIENEKYRCTIDSAVLFDTEKEKYFGGIIYYDKESNIDLGKNPLLIMDLDKNIFLKSDKVSNADFDFIISYMNDNINFIKSNINNDAQALIHFGKFKKI